MYVNFFATQALSLLGHFADPAVNKKRRTYKIIKLIQGFDLKKIKALTNCEAIAHRNNKTKGRKEYTHNRIMCDHFENLVFFQQNLSELE